MGQKFKPICSLLWKKKYEIFNKKYGMKKFEIIITRSQQKIIYILKNRGSQTFNI